MYLTRAIFPSTFISLHLFDLLRRLMLRPMINFEIYMYKSTFNAWKLFNFVLKVLTNVVRKPKWCLRSVNEICKCIQEGISIRTSLLYLPPRCTLDLNDKLWHCLSFQCADSECAGHCTCKAVRTPQELPHHITPWIVRTQWSTMRRWFQDWRSQHTRKRDKGHTPN